MWLVVVNLSGVETDHERRSVCVCNGHSGVQVALADSSKAALGKRGLRHTVDVRRLHGLPPTATTAAAAAADGRATVSLLHSTLGEDDTEDNSRWSAEAVDMLAGLARLELVGEAVGDGGGGSGGGGGGGGVLFTAPHGLSLRREGFAHHKPEDYTTRLAKSFAQALGSSAVVWAEGERSKSEFLKLPDRFNADPNYLVRGSRFAHPFASRLLAQSTKWLRWGSYSWRTLASSPLSLWFGHGQTTGLFPFLSLSVLSRRLGAGALRIRRGASWCIAHGTQRWRTTRPPPGKRKRVRGGCMWTCTGDATTPPAWTWTTATVTSGRRRWSTTKAR